MGVVASNFRGGDGGIVADMIRPSNENWIAKHAEACNMSVSQVTELWGVFQKHGCNSDGELPSTAIRSIIAKSSSRSESVFIAKVIKQFPQTEGGGISFQTYCNATKWFSDGDIETRIRGAFRILNNGNPLTKTILLEILREIYADTSEAVIQRTAQVFLKEVDAKGQGSINEDSFVTWVQRMPSNVVEEIMKFEALSSQSSPKNAPTPQQARADSDRPSISLLQRVADNAKNRDWLLLVNKLGFTEDEIKEAGDALGNQKHEQHLFELLKIWREKRDTVVTTETLRDALVSSGMEDVSIAVQA